ncbi:MAG: hypothetical protein AB3N63_03505 [Puniceicoccaceae bacterium]
MDNIYFRAICPMCLEEKEFHFKFEPTGVEDEEFVRRIYCEKCGVDYSPQTQEEADDLYLVAQIIEKMLKGKISEEDGVGEIDSVNSKVINDLLDASEMWTCSKCGEENYSTLSECWKCQNINPEAKDVEFEAPEKVDWDYMA